MRNRVLSLPGSHFLKWSTILATPSGPFQLFDYITLGVARRYTYKPAKSSSESLMIIHGKGSRGNIDSESRSFSLEKCALVLQCFCVWEMPPASTWRSLSTRDRLSALHVKTSPASLTQCTCGEGSSMMLTLMFLRASATHIQLDLCLLTKDMWQI